MIPVVSFNPCHIREAHTLSQTAFGWSFEDHGPDHAAFSGEGLDGGFFRAEMAATTGNGGALIVVDSDRLEETLAKVIAAGGRIVKPIFPFRGGDASTSPSPAATSLRCGAHPTPDTPACLPKVPIPNKEPACR